KRSAPAPSAAVTPGQSNDFASRTSAQVKKAAEAPAKNAANAAAIKLDETNAVNARERELVAQRKAVEEQERIKSENLAKVQATMPKSEPSIVLSITRPKRQTPDEETIAA